MLPVAAFALALSIGASSGLSVAGSIGWFILGLCVLIVLCLFALYPLTVFLAKVRFRDFAQAAVPAQTVAAGTRSSIACLPALLEGAEEHLTWPLFMAAGVPVQALIVLKVADAIPDILKTVLNVTADLSVATIIARFSTQQVPATAALASR